MDANEPEIIKSGVVALAGPPNAGKSTLLNTLLGQKISIVTPKPQTTRNRIAGVLNGEGYQIVLLDTPGLHRSPVLLNKEMVQVALDALQGVEAVVFMVDVSQHRASEENREKQEYKSYLETVDCPAFLLLNKIDLMSRKDLLPIIEFYATLFPFTAVIPVSALKGEGLEHLVDELVALMPLGFRYFPDDVPTDATERFLSAEIIREKVFLLTGQEIPYSSAVLIESFKENNQRRLVEIHASIYLERKSQKGIVIGKGGEKIKQIGTAARKDIEEMLDCRVLLNLWVKIRKHWSRDQRFLKELGF
ncbi:MAG: GTPase Era [Desulfofustis sp.]|nr:GTPase Era [Desulfofustis sp.]NNK57671.1 GTPase Era [Desulfofustis sp.]